MKVLIAFYGGGHVAAAIPMIRELRRRGHEVVALALTVSVETMRRSNLPFKTILDYVDSFDDEIRRFGTRLAERHHTDGKGVQLEASIAYLGSGFADLVSELGEREATEQYRKHGLKAFMPIPTAKRILQIEKPDCVIATASPRMEAALLRAAVSLNILSVCVIDLFAILEIPWLRHPQHAHLLTVYSDRARDRLIAAGRSPSSIHIAGNPAFDSLADPDLPCQAALWRAGKKLSERARVVLWAEQPEPGNPDLPRQIRSYLADLCADNDWDLVVRLHPASSDPRGETIPSTAIQSESFEPLPVVAMASDIVITMTSTVAMEGLLLGKPAIVLKGSQYDELVDYSASDGAYIAADVSQIERGIRELQTDGDVARQLSAARKALPSVGEASRRVVDLIERSAASGAGLSNERMLS